MNCGFTLVDEPLIEYVIDQADGKEYGVGEYISASAREISEIRVRVYDAWQRSEPNIICVACHRPAYPRKNVKTGKFHFAHVSEGDNKYCPYNDKKRFDTTRINSMRYNGQKEGPDHRLLKSLLRASIDTDPLFDPDQTREEKNWYGSTDEKKWRRPDIAATRRLGDNNSLRIAFEIQLSSTYLKVIAARREFYLKEENALLFWVFKDASGIDPRQYQDDLFYNNNSNLFVVDEETVRLSQEQGKLILRCCYYEPVLVGATVSDIWRERVVSFDELTVDTDRQRVYWFDYKAEKAKLLETAEEVIREREEEELRARYEDFWNNIHLRKCSDPVAEYRRLRHQLSMHDIAVPERHDRELERFTQMVFSAKTGEGFLTGLKTILEVANNSYLYGKPFLWYFGRVLQHYGTWDKLLAQDKNAEQRKKMSGKKHESWKEKGKIIKQKIDANDPDFIQNRSLDKLFFLLFPDIIIPPTAA